MNLSNFPVDHSTLLNSGFCTSCGEKVVHSEEFCENGHAMAGTLKFCTSCGKARRRELVIPPPRVVNARPSNASENSASVALDNYLVKLQAATNQNQSSAPEFKGANRPLIVGVSIGVGGVLLAIIAFVLISGAVKTDITVNMTIIGESCSNITWGYLDIPGGTISLSVDGASVGSSSYGAYGTTTATGCQFSTVLAGVKENGSSYQVTSGNAIRGSITETKSQLSSDNWTFNLTLGSN